MAKMIFADKEYVKSLKTRTKNKSDVYKKLLMFSVVVNIIELIIIIFK